MMKLVVRKQLPSYQVKRADRRAQGPACRLAHVQPVWLVPALAVGAADRGRGRGRVHDFMYDGDNLLSYAEVTKPKNIERLYNFERGKTMLRMHAPQLSEEESVQKVD